MRALVLATAVFGAASATVVAPAAFAQSQSVNGTIRGRVEDPSGAAVPGATVTVSNKQVGFERTITTGNDGYYTLVNLPLGEYTVSFTAAGFSALKVNSVNLQAGTEATIDGALKIGGTESVVEVTASDAAIDPTNLNVQRTLEQREVENAPLTSRNPYNFIVFQPGVSGHPNPELGIPRTLNTNGLMDRINYQMDGMVNTQADRYGLRLFPIGQIFVKEVQTVSNAVAPEYGWTAGDVYNVISNSGTNQFHGMFQYIQRWQDATAYPLLTIKTPTTKKPNLELEDISFNAGGPVIKNKLFFFGSYEKLTRGSPSPVSAVTIAAAPQIGISADELNPAPGLLHGTFTDARLDWTITPKHQMFLRYNYFKNAFPYNTQVGGINTRSANVDYKDRAHVGAMQLISTLSNSMINEFRVSLPFRANTHFAGPNTGTGPAIVISNVAAFGGTSNSGDQYNDKQPSGSDVFSIIHGRHSMKAGFILDQLQNKQRAVSYNRYTFASVNDYLAAKNGTNTKSYSLYESQTDVNGVNYASLFFGAFVQDTWQISPKFIAVYGVRYDRFKSPNSNPNAPWADSRTFNTPATNFAPRLGFTYRAYDTTVVKVSGGLFYDQVPTNLWYNALNQDGSNRTSVFSYTPSQAGSPAFPNVPSSSGGTIPVQNVTTVNPNIKNPYTWNVNAQLTQQLSSKDALTLGYIMSSGRNLYWSHNINLVGNNVNTGLPVGPIGFLADGRPRFNSAVNDTTRVNSRFNRVDRVESGANSSFNAMFINYRMTPRRGMQINASYTWSHTISDAPEVNTFEQNLGVSNTLNRKFDRGNSSVNRPSAFNITATLEPKFSLSNKVFREIANHNMLSVLGNISSGDQSNILATNAVYNGDPSTAGVGRAAFTGRNTLRGPKIAQVDARFTRTFPKLFDRIAPSFLIEANNVFNHNNITGITVNQVVNATTGIATATNPATATTVLEQRIVQWGAAVRF